MRITVSYCEILKILKNKIIQKLTEILRRKIVKIERKTQSEDYNMI